MNMFFFTSRSLNDGIETKLFVRNEFTKQTIEEGERKKKKREEVKISNVLKFQRKHRGNILAVITPRFIPLKLLSRDRSIDRDQKIERYLGLEKCPADWPVRVSGIVCNRIVGYAAPHIIIIFAYNIFYNSIFLKPRII